MIFYFHTVSKFGDELNSLLKDFSKTQVQKKAKTYRINVRNNISLYIDFLAAHTKFHYVINKKEISITASGDANTFIISNGDERYFLQFYLPSNGKISQDEDRLIISGHNSRSDHKTFLCIISKEEIKQLQPLLATNKNYPDNFICGFDIRTNDKKYIVFKHSKNAHLNSDNKAKYKTKDISVLRFDGEMLENIWAFDRENGLEEY